MNKSDDFLVEIHTEELPPKTLFGMGKAFCDLIKERLEKAELAFEGLEFFATPRRLAVFVKNLAALQPDQIVERKGPAKKAAFDAQGRPSKACIGFAKSLGVDPSELMTIRSAQGEWVGLKHTVPGKPVTEIMPAIIEEAVRALPIRKRMRWNNADTQFVRPVHSIILLYGEEIIKATILSCEASRTTQGHRFLAPDWISIPNASAYVSLLKTAGFVLADFKERKKAIREQAEACVKKILQNKAEVLIISEDFLDEVTGLVEYPIALCGQFAQTFLELPREVLVSAMQQHQRYFPVVAKDGTLLPYFVTISNIATHDMSNVLRGNERVLRARLHDAQFFYAADKKENLYSRVERLKGIIFQDKLGTLYEKAERLSNLAGIIAKKIKADETHASRAGWLAKTDLTTNMVGEFPDLQGVMGYYYALYDHEPNDIAQALLEQYLPRFAGDTLPKNPVGQALAIADRIDTLAGTFGINELPTGDKDPYGLRRAAIGVLRILLENHIDLDLKELFLFAINGYGKKLDNKEAITQILNFMQERLRSLYLEQGVASDVFAAVAALNISNPLDMDERIKAVIAFKKLNESEMLSIANKRVSNILAKYTDVIDAHAINPAFFENSAEQELARQLEEKARTVEALHALREYDKELVQLAELRKPIDDFFDKVMVMTEDKSKRENRILLLSKLRALFLQVADIALLQ